MYVQLESVTVLYLSWFCYVARQCGFHLLVCTVLADLLLHVSTGLHIALNEYLDPIVV